MQTCLLSQSPSLWAPSTCPVVTKLGTGPRHSGDPTHRSNSQAFSPSAFEARPRASQRHAPARCPVSGRQSRIDARCPGSECMSGRPAGRSPRRAAPTNVHDTAEPEIEVASRRACSPRKRLPPRASRTSAPAPTPATSGRRAAVAPRLSLPVDAQELGGGPSGSGSHLRPACRGEDGCKRDC